MLWGCGFADMAHVSRAAAVASPPSSSVSCTRRRRCARGRRSWQATAPPYTHARERSQEHRWAQSRLLFSRREASLHQRMALPLQPSERQHLGLSWVTRPAGASLPILAPRAQGSEGSRMVAPRPRCHLRASVPVGRPGRGVPPGGPNSHPRAVGRPAQLLDRWVPARPCSVLTLGGMQFRGLRSPWSLCELSSCQHRASVPTLPCVRRQQECVRGWSATFAPPSLFASFLPVLLGYH